MIITAFRLRLSEDPAILAEYMEWARKLNDIVPTLPGYVSHKRFTADDGERCTIVEFADMDGHDAWAQHPVHLQAKALGRRKFFTSYDIKVASVVKTMTK
jgi:heme-degrading monooxygenase HmoA